MHKNMDQLGQQSIFFHRLFEWLKFIELSMTMIIGIVEDERFLSNMGFMKSKLRNKLTTWVKTCN
jgi:hypothetical protein